MFKTYGYIKNLLFSIVVLIVGFSLSFNYFSGADAKKKNNLKELVRSGVITKATYSEQYLVKTVTQLGAKKESFTFDYYFEVAGKTYGGKQNLRSLPTTTQVEVKYLKEDPAINSTNPEQDLESSKNESMPFLGIILILVGVIYLVFLFSKVLSK